MKLKIITTPNYLLVVDDSEIKEGDWFLTDDKRVEQSAYDWNARKWHKKIIAHLPLNDSPILEGVPLLPPLEVEDFNPMDEYDEEYLSSLKFDGKSFVSHVLLATRVGYNKAKEKYKFTEEDMRKAIEMSRDIKYVAYSLDEIIQSFSQPKTYTHFEFKMESISKIVNDNWQDYESIKTTTNSQGQEVACGKYIY